MRLTCTFSFSLLALSLAGCLDEPDELRPQPSCEYSASRVDTAVRILVTADCPAASVLRVRLESLDGAALVQTVLHSQLCPFEALLDLESFPVQDVRVSVVLSVLGSPARSLVCKERR